MGRKKFNMDPKKVSGGDIEAQFDIPGSRNVDNRFPLGNRLWTSTHLSHDCLCTEASGSLALCFAMLRILRPCHTLRDPLDRSAYSLGCDMAVRAGVCVTGRAREGIPCSWRDGQVFAICFISLL